MAFGLYRPHVPFVAPKSYFDLYDINDFNVPSSSENYLKSIPKPAAFSIRSKKEQVYLDNELSKEIKLAYYATTSFMDSQVGRVLDKLKETGLDKNTIIVFTSDHGYHLGEHGHWQKQTLFENATRVPLIFSGPNIKNNTPIKDPVELIDIYPTIMDMLTMQTPDFVSGRSLLPQIENPNYAVRKSALTELLVNKRNLKAQGYSIKTKRYRLNQWNYDGIFSYELYDHKFDKQELYNLAETKDYKNIKDSLTIIIKQRIIDANKVPIDLGRQIENAQPWFEPKRIFPKNKEL